MIGAAVALLALLARSADRPTVADPDGPQPGGTAGSGPASDPSTNGFLVLVIDGDELTSPGWTAWMLSWATGTVLVLFGAALAFARLLQHPASLTGTTIRSATDPHVERTTRGGHGRRQDAAPRTAMARSYEGALVSGMVYLGDELGMYEAMNGEGPLTSAAVAAKAGLHERFVREWLHVQVAAGILDHPGDGLFELSPEAGILLADQGDVRSMAGLFDGFLSERHCSPSCRGRFRTGIGVSWADTERGGTPTRVRWMERFLRPWYEQVLIPGVLPNLKGIVEKLERGAKVADVGCGMASRW